FVTAVSALAIALSYESPCPAAMPEAIDGDSMRAVMQRCYGAPSVLAVERIAKPVPASGEILIKVHAAGVNPFEWHMTTGKPCLLRLFKGLGAPDHPRTGSDFAGIVESVGAGVTRFKAGDEVFGGKGGALAEYVVAREDADIVLKPAGMTFEQAAAIPIAAVTALQALRDHGRIVAGQKVLINGASGGVGTYAVQIAKSYGAEVTGVCSTRNVELVRSLGADHVIDYTQEDFTEGTERYDLIFDTAGNHGLLKLRGALKPKGVLVGIGGSKRDPWIGPLWGMAKRKIVAAFIDQTLASFIANVTTAELEFLANLAREGKLRTAIDRRYSLEETGAALEYIGSRRARGKVVVTLD
ncbi:MAG TPA: NAD(P)-dependent alcohol dehydrogenase, partial [Steroidobacteraceae bacterium]|nr:NAD(P)-dependent alcohol dehydrogenase [Steroidobacteraceae bacterium]